MQRSKNTPRDQFINALLSHNLKTVEALLKSGVSANLVFLTDQGKPITPVEFAMNNGYPHLLVLLLDNGGKVKPGLHLDAPAPIKPPTENKLEDFKQSVKDNDLVRLKALLPTFENLAAPIDSDRNTALHHACMTKNPEMISLLLSSPFCHLHYLNRYQKTAVDLVVEKQDNASLYCLKEHPEFKDQINACFKAAVDKKQNVKVAYLLTCYEFPELDKLDWAIQCNDLAAFQRLLKNGMKTNAVHFKHALENLNTEMVDVLLKNNTELDLTQGNSLLELAIAKQWRVLAPVVAARPTNVLDPYGYTYILFEAIKQRNEGMTRLLINAKTPLTCLYNDNGKRLLASLRGDKTADDIIEALITAAIHYPSLLEYIRLQCIGLPAELESYFDDSVFTDTLTHPVITPLGYTYQREALVHWLSEKKYDPVSNMPLEEYDLRPNHSILGLYNYYISEGDHGEPSIPPLINPCTNGLYEDPVVADDGRTYERSDLIKYLQTHHGELPQDNLYLQGQAHIQLLDQLRPNRLLKTIIDEVYLKRQFCHALKNRDFASLGKIISRGFSIKTKLDANGNQAIHLAIMKNDLELLDFCLKGGADITDENQNKESALWLAMSHPEHAEALKHLIGRDGNLLDNLDASLPRLIQNKDLEKVTALLKTEIPLRSLMTLNAYAVLSNLLVDKANNQPLITLLMVESQRKHPAIAFHVRQLLNPAPIIHVDVPEEFDEILCDPILMEPFVNPAIVPSGQSFNYIDAAKMDINPITRAPVNPDQCRINQLLADVVAYFQTTENNVSEIPPLLFSLLTGQLMTLPVVADNGVTYDKAELDAYKGAHNNNLPDHIGEHCYPDRTLHTLCERYRPKPVEVSVVGRSLFTPVRPVAENDNKIREKPCLN